MQILNIISPRYIEDVWIQKRVLTLVFAPIWYTYDIDKSDVYVAIYQHKLCLFLLDPAPPVVTTLPPSPIQDTVVGDPQVIDCIATTLVTVDVNLLNFTWISPGGNTITNSSRITIHPTIAIENMYISSLQFDHLIIGDGGDYICRVTFFNVIEPRLVTMEEPDCECVLHKGV